MRKEGDVIHERVGRRIDEKFRIVLSRGGNHATMQNIVKCISTQRYDRS